MKTILILTDFSENATHAAISAAMVIEKLHAHVLLYHTYYDSPVIPAYAGGSLVISEFSLLKKESIIKLNHLEVNLRRKIMEISVQGFRPAIDCLCGEGPLGNNVADILKEKDIELIVMGASANGNIHHLFFGSDTLSVIDHASCTVLVIPPEVEMNKIRKVTLAAGYELADINAINYLVDLGRIFNYELAVVHVSLRSEEENQARGKAIRSHIEAIKQTNISCREIKGKNVVKRLNNVCKENGSDILALVHYQRGFFDNMLNTSNAGEALLIHRIPLLVIPAKTTK